MRRLLEEVVSLAAPEVDDNAVAIVRNLPPDPVDGKADLDFIKQAHPQPLLSTASMRLPRADNATISARRDENMVITEIEDTGGGIPIDA